jgi:hypothetical protein
MIFYVCTSAYAGFPFLTDDPAPVEYQHYEMNAGIQQTRTTDGTSGTLPFIELNYGVTSDVQLHISAPLESNLVTFGPRQYGYGDTELGVKYRIAQETPELPMIAIYPTIELPTGNPNKGLGNGKTQLFLPIWFEKNWDTWQSNIGGGYWINNAAATMKDHWFTGWQLQKDMSERLTLGAEIFYSTEQTVGQGNNSGFNIGGNYNFDAQNHLLFSIGKGISNVAVDKSMFYLGYQRNW